MNILLAEDDSDDIYIFIVELSYLKIPHQLSSVRDGEALMKRLADEIPDILFLDINMPVKDGRACIIEIRSDSRFEKMPVVILSCEESIRTRVHFEEAGADGFLDKPASLSHLSHQLEDLLLNSDLLKRERRV